ncbi:hypothetical protein C7999DRAFT_43575 [Corynascus novoguineensis]|uniref:Subtilisin-like serine protease n=1 Tax=Corynascus novoguineensis TaxID=1126955 RepID=A0AAN7HCM4_9PEZI|nr:hypothetical protein C7999DRAFT_43575 [Corynascus novoguineensis]
MSAKPSAPHISLSDFPVPFPKSSELCSKLTVTTGGYGVELESTVPGESWLPGQPAVPLSSCANAIMPYLRKDLMTPRLDKMFPYLWLVATQSSSHISALHEQRVRGREVIIAENPELHLVWADNRVFIKPLPPYLLSHAFWQAYLTPMPITTPAVAKTPLLIPGITTQEDQEDILRSALGFMRTYYYLIRHESDFRLAQDLHILPASPLTFAAFVAFISHFSPDGAGSSKPVSVTDDFVSPRYRFGQLRLTRLNLWAKPALGQWKFHKLSWQYAETFARLYPPLLFAFALISIVLSAFQVGAQAAPQWETFAAVAAWFAVAALTVVGVVGVTMLSLLVCMVAREFVFAMCVE